MSSWGPIDNRRKPGSKHVLGQNGKKDPHLFCSTGSQRASTKSLSPFPKRWAVKRRKIMKRVWFTRDFLFALSSVRFYAGLFKRSIPRPRAKRIKFKSFDHGCCVARGPFPLFKPYCHDIFNSKRVRLGKEYWLGGHGAHSAILAKRLGQVPFLSWIPVIPTIWTIQNPFRGIFPLTPGPRPPTMDR